MTGGQRPTTSAYAPTTPPAAVIRARTNPAGCVQAAQPLPADRVAESRRHSTGGARVAGKHQHATGSSAKLLMGTEPAPDGFSQAAKPRIPAAAQNTSAAISRVWTRGEFRAADARGVSTGFHFPAAGSLATTAHTRAFRCRGVGRGSRVCLRTGRRSCSTCIAFLMSDTRNTPIVLPLEVPVERYA